VNGVFLILPNLLLFFDGHQPCHIVFEAIHSLYNVVFAMDCLSILYKMTSFEELLVSQMTQKAQQNNWKDPSKNWGQNEGLQKVGGQGNKGGNW